jgi:hypothetical protein
MGTGARAFFLNRPRVSLESSTGKELLERKSIHADAAEERKEDVVASILGRLEQEEKMEEAVKQLHSLKVKVYVCEMVRGGRRELGHASPNWLSVCCLFGMCSCVVRGGDVCRGGGTCSEGGSEELVEGHRPPWCCRPRVFVV